MKKLEKESVPELFAKFGKKLKISLTNKINEIGMSDIIAVQGMDWLPCITVKGNEIANELLISSLLRQELVAEGVLATRTLNLSFAHCLSKDIELKTMSAFECALGRLAEALKSGDPSKRLRGEMIKSVFQVRS